MPEVAGAAATMDARLRRVALQRAAGRTAGDGHISDIIAALWAQGMQPLQRRQGGPAQMRIPR